MKKATIILGIDPGLIASGYSIIKINNTLFSKELYNNFLEFNVKPITKKHSSSIENIQEHYFVELLIAGEIINISKEKRLSNIFHNISDIVKTYNPDICVIEDTFVNNNSKTSLALGKARGIAMLVCELYNKPIIEISNKIVKKRFTKYGNAKKEEIQNKVQEIFNIKITHNASDAIAIALSIIPSYSVKKFQ